jgi:predicted RNA-binding protein (virulence factor B family)
MDAASNRRMLARAKVPGVTHDDDPVGRRVSLRVRRIGGPGAFLAKDEQDPKLLLLPRREVPQGLAVGDEIEVFVYLDSDDTPIATTAAPGVMLGDVAFLEVVSLEPFGAFVAWGLPKDLLVPKDEMIRDVRVGERHAIGLYLDDTRRLAGTMRVSELLRGSHAFRVGDWVEGEAWRKEPGLGVFVIVEKRFVGLLPESEPHRLSRGERARFRVSHVHRDGKFELSLRGLAHEERDRDAERIVEVLRERPGTFGDGSSPDELRAAFGLSKKAFKRALGGLLRSGQVVLDEAGNARLADQSS